MFRKYMTIFAACLSVMTFSACSDTSTGTSSDDKAYVNITQEEAKHIMDTEENYIILDVRTQEEYDSGHIPNAILIPDTEIEEKAEGILTDKNQLILVYCRSGRRSKNAAAILEKKGYTNIKEFGGIIDWQYETEVS
ncbi:MAG: rhodanese-like domain-containing protein [Ruminococcus sp.]